MGPDPLSESLYMPPWFESWYLDILKEVHRKLGDPEVSISWLQDQLKVAGQPGAVTDSWKKQVDAQLTNLPEPPAYSQPEGWESLIQNEALTQLLKGIKPIKTSHEAQLIEASLDSFHEGQALSEGQAFLVWNYLLGTITPQDEHQLRHWVDAEPEHLAAFEQRFELWDQLRALPALIHSDPKTAWEGAFGGVAETPESTSGTSWSRAAILVGMIIGLVVVLGMFVWMRQSDSIPFELSETMKGVVLEGEQIPELSGQKLEVQGVIQLLMEDQDSLQMFGGLIVLQSGVYQIHQDGSQQSISVQEGELKAFLEEEILMVGAGFRLRKQQGVWLKESE